MASVKSSRSAKLGAVALSALALASCANLQLSNIPSYAPAYQYITLTSSNASLYRALHNELTKRQLVTISPDSTPEELRQVVHAVSAYYASLAQLGIQLYPTNSSKSANSANSAATKSATNKSTLNKNSAYSSTSESDLTLQTSKPVTLDTNSTTEFDKKLEATNNTNEEFIAQGDNPAHRAIPGITRIEQCAGANLTYQCVANFIPNLEVRSYRTTSTPISLYADGDTAQNLRQVELNTSFSMPYLGSISLIEQVSDASLSSSNNPMANIRLQEKLDDTYMLASASQIVNKVEYILEDLTARQARMVEQRLNTNRTTQQLMDETENDIQRQQIQLKNYILNNYKK